MPHPPDHLEMTLIHAGGDEGITSQAQNSAVATGRDTHVTDQHCGKLNGFLHTAPFRKGLSYIF
jgi:hypothetical protein